MLGIDWDIKIFKKIIYRLKIIFHCQPIYFYSRASHQPYHTGFLGWCSTEGLGGCFHLHPVTPLSFKSDNSNFVQNYFGIGSIFWDNKGRDQIKNDVTMTSSLP